MSYIEPDSKLNAPKQSSNLPTKIPPNLYQFFWDVDVKKLDPAEKPYFIIQRLLDKGNIEAVRWVRENYEPEIVRFTLENFRDFSLRSASFWATLYNLPLVKVKCFQKPYLKTRRTLWPY